MKIDIIILNYNGVDLLKRFLPSVCAAAKYSKHECEVIVVDNLSEDLSIDYLRDNVPSVRTIIAKENKVLCSYNDIIEGLNSDVVVLLNNDIKLKEDSIDPLVGHFDVDEVMFVAPKVLNMDNSFNGGKSHLETDHGILKMIVDHETFEDKGRTQSIACGAFRRNMFFELGGFDEIFLPGIWEEVDLCYRGLKKGLIGIYEPESVFWHMESTTFNREFGERGKLILAHRNMFVFYWKNITDGWMFFTHVTLIVPRFIVQVFLGRTEMLVGFFRALTLLPKVLVSRKKVNAKDQGYVYSDRQLIIR